ncbi:MAG: DUF2115 domain-containing protein [Methanomicrobiales archaeon]
MSKIEEIDLTKKITKDHLLNILKKEASHISIKDIMMASAFLREDAKYMQKKYREDYIKRFTDAFFRRLRQLKNDKTDYSGDLNTEKLGEMIHVLKNQEEEALKKGNKNELSFIKIAKIIPLYTTFIRQESIHPVGTIFPGGLRLRYKEGKYLCPVKEKQLKTPNALCRFCVSVQDESVKE